MRETRLSSSEGGAAQPNALSLPLSDVPSRCPADDAETARRVGRGPPAPPWVVRAGRARPRRQAERQAGVSRDHPW